MINENKNISLHHKLFKATYLTVFLSVALISLFAFSLIFFYSSNNIMNNIQEITKQKVTLIEINLGIIDELVRSIVFNSQLQDALHKYNVSQIASKNDLRIEMKKIVQNLTMFFPQVQNLLVYAKDGELVGSLYSVSENHNIVDQLRGTSLIESKGNMLWFTDEGLISSDKPPQFIAKVVKTIRSIKFTNEMKLGDDLGFFELHYNFSSISNLLQKPDKTTEFFLINSTGITLGSSEKFDVGKRTELINYKSIKTPKIILINNQRKIIYSRIVESFNENWYCFCVMPYSTVFSDVKTIMFTAFSMAIIILVISFMLSWKNANEISFVFQDMNNKIEQIEKGKKNVQVESKSSILEVEQLVQHFNHMALRLDDLVYELYSAEIKKEAMISEMKEAKLQALQMQINPHFLFNTLDTINWAALIQGNKEVSKMVLALGDLFRMNVNMSESLTVIRDEIKRVELFMYLEKIRFGNKIEWGFDVDEDLLDYEIMSFLLQPIVENAIIHGIEPLEKTGKILISIKQKKEKICVIIKDNGQGIPTHTLAQLQHQWTAIDILKKQIKTNNGNIGLSNIVNRLYLLYQDNFQFNIESDSLGTEVIIIFPLSKNK